MARGEAQSAACGGGHGLVHHFAFEEHCARSRGLSGLYCGHQPGIAGEFFRGRGEDLQRQCLVFAARLQELGARRGPTPSAPPATRGRPGCARSAGYRTPWRASGTPADPRSGAARTGRGSSWAPRRALVTRTRPARPGRASTAMCLPAWAGSGRPSAGTSDPNDAQGPGESELTVTLVPARAGRECWDRPRSRDGTQCGRGAPRTVGLGPLTPR